MFQEQLSMIIFEEKIDYCWRKTEQKLILANGSELWFRTHRQMTHPINCRWLYVMDVNRLPETAFQVMRRGLKPTPEGPLRMLLETSAPLQPGSWQYAQFCEQPPETVRVFSGKTADNPCTVNWSVNPPTVPPLPQLNGPDPAEEENLVRKMRWIWPPAPKLRVQKRYRGVVRRKLHPMPKETTSAGSGVPTGLCMPQASPGFCSSSANDDGVQPSSTSHAVTQSLWETVLNAL